MPLHFSKYHGTGNDFIMIDASRESVHALNPQTISGLCDRHTGIGADGLIMISESGHAEFKMVYFNSDGHESTLCGNGGRCAVLFASKAGFFTGKSVRFEAPDGIHQAGILTNRHIRLEMGDVPSVKIESGQYILDTGSPHLVIPVKDVDSLDVRTHGRKLSQHKKYRPRGINVNFMEFLDEYVFIRTYERGVEDETMSCGTGAVASAISAVLEKKCDKNSMRVKTNGGYLLVHLGERSGGQFKKISLEGPAIHIFDGSVSI